MIYTDYMGKRRYQEHPMDDFPVGMGGGNSWYLKVPLSDCHNILGETTDYQVHAYACKCGTEHTYITDKFAKKATHICLQCGNSGFFNVADIDRYDEYLINIDGPAQCTLEGDDAYARLFVSIPKSVDLARDKVLYESKKIFELKISLVGKESVYRGWEKINSDIQEEVYKELLYYVGEHYLKEKMHDYEALQMDQRTFPQMRKAISFFLKYSEFKHSELLSWAVIDDDLYHNGGVEKTPLNLLEFLRSHKTQSSIKRALYRRYKEEISEGKFYPINSYIICRIFDDPNFTTRMLDHHDIVFTYSNDYQSISLFAASHIRLVEFLKQHYSEKQIFQMFQNMGDDPSYWEDSVSMFNSLFDNEQISTYFQSPRANVRAIHDELVRSRYLLRNIYNKSVDFIYTEMQTKPCVLWRNKLQIVLPENGAMLNEWSYKLHNCVYGYIGKVANFDTTIYGVEEKGVLNYAIEIKNGSIIQMKGAYNAEPNKDIKKLLNEWYQYYFGTSLKEEIMLEEYNNA